MTCKKCEDLSIPRRLWRESKPTNNVFTNKCELLFRWFPPSIEGNEVGENLSAAIVGPVFTPLADISCNREKFCENPTDVLFNQYKLPHREDYGVIETSVREIEDFTFQYELGNAADLIVVKLELAHKPEMCMYPHTEIIVYRNGERITENPKPNSLKTALRENISTLFRVRHSPSKTFRMTQMESSLHLLRRILCKPRCWKQLLTSFLNNSNEFANWKEIAQNILDQAP